MSEIIKQDKAESVELVNRESLSDIAKFANTNEMLQFFDMMVRSGRTGAKTKEEALAIYIQAKELGLGFTCASTHLHVIDGKPGLDIHIIRALLLKAGTNIWWEVKENYVPLYKYTDNNGVIYSTDSLPTNSIICNSEIDTKRAKDENKIPLLALRDSKGVLFPPYDRRSTIIFYREIKLESGKWITLTEEGQFTYGEAIAAGLVYKADGTPKTGSAWIKYPTNQLYTRAFVLGARKIGSDVLLGMYETSELYDIQDVSYELTDEGNVNKI